MDYNYNKLIGFAGISKSKVELTLLDIGTGHLDGDRVAQLELMMMAAADKTVVALVKLVVVVVKFAHRNHALALVLVTFNIESPLGNAADCSVELLSHSLASANCTAVF